jgi:hypothetical protein
VSGGDFSDAVGGTNNTLSTVHSNKIETHSVMKIAVSSVGRETIYLRLFYLFIRDATVRQPSTLPVRDFPGNCRHE